MEGNLTILTKLELIEQQAIENIAQSQRIIKSVTELKKSLTGKPGKTGTGKGIMKEVMLRREKALGRRKY